MKKQTSILIQRYFLALLIFLGAGALAYAAPPQTATSCEDEIAQVEKFISKEGADEMSSERAKRAASICQTEFTKSEMSYFKVLADSCDQSFKGLDGSVSQAMLSMCNLNAARFVISLQMPANNNFMLKPESLGVHP